jgi:hypothetical protein
MSSDSTQVAFCDRDTRDDEIHRTIDQCLDDLVQLVEEAIASEQFQDWHNIVLGADCRSPKIEPLLTRDQSIIDGYSTGPQSDRE